jgi:hypothetical protein
LLVLQDDSSYWEGPEKWVEKDTDEDEEEKDLETDSDDDS